MERGLESELEEIAGSGAGPDLSLLAALEATSPLPANPPSQIAAEEPQPPAEEPAIAQELDATLSPAPWEGPPIFPPELVELPSPTPAAPPPYQPPLGGSATLSELILHCAEDSVFFCRHFFPKVFRQGSPQFHRDMWALLDHPDKRYINLQVMRDGAKTTILRAYTAKRIAYGLSRTILYIGASESKALASVSWVKTQIEQNRAFTATFGLRRGRPWTDGRLKIEHGTEGHAIWVLGMGISGSVRGINLDNYRPDLIIVDDVVGDDSAATDEQRTKIVDLVLGALKESLSPRSETPDAKMVILNTPRDFSDLSSKALKDTQFHSARYGCWTPETENLPIELQESSWPDRYSSAVLREEKLAAIARNSLSIFAREKECRLITPESSYFREEWIKYFGLGEEEGEPPRHEMQVVYVIDPVPPPSDAELARGLIKKDFEAHCVVGKWKGKFYVLEMVAERGHDPSWTTATFFELCMRWKPQKVIVETVAYQKALVWILKQAMRRAGRYWLIEEFKDKRHKTVRINQGLKAPLAEGQVFFRKKQTTLLSQVVHYPGKNPDSEHDDEIEVVAIGIESLNRGFVGEAGDDYFQMQEKEIPALEYARGAP